MIMDAALSFTGSTPGGPDSPTSGAQVSTNVIDLGVQQDLGVGDDPAMKLVAVVTTAFTGGTSLQVSVAGSTDNSTFTVMASGPVISEANLVVGTHLCDIDLPRIAGPLYTNPGASQARPRYLRLQYTSAGTHSTGALVAGFLLDRADHNTNYPSSHSTLFPPGV